MRINQNVYMGRSMSQFVDDTFIDYLILGKHRHLYDTVTQGSSVYIEEKNEKCACFDLKTEVLYCFIDEFLIPENENDSLTIRKVKLYINKYHKLADCFLIHYKCLQLLENSIHLNIPETSLSVLKSLLMETVLIEEESTIRNIKKVIKEGLMECTINEQQRNKASLSLIKMHSFCHTIQATNKNTILNQINDTFLKYTDDYIKWIFGEDIPVENFITEGFFIKMPTNETLLNRPLIPQLSMDAALLLELGYTNLTSMDSL